MVTATAQMPGNLIIHSRHLLFTVRRWFWVAEVEDWKSLGSSTDLDQSS